jgi:hypothetical protein
VRLLETASIALGCFAGGLISVSWWAAAMVWPAVALALFSLLAALADTWFNARASQADNATTLRLEALEVKVEALQKFHALQSLR